MAKLFKQLRFCKRCGKKFEVKHQLRYYCDECKFRGRKKALVKQKAAKKADERKTVKKKATGEKPIKKKAVKKQATKKKPIKRIAVEKQAIKIPKRTRKKKRQ